MANKLIRYGNVKDLKSKFRINAPEFTPIDQINRESEEEYKGPSIEEVQEEINLIRKASEEEIRTKRKELEKESKHIIELAESGAFERIKAANEEHKRILLGANSKSEEIVHKSKIEGEKIIQDAQSQKSQINQEAYDEGYKQGLEKAFEEGKEELNTIISRLEKILSETINKRNEIIQSSEKQLINIATIIARKVVKTLSESSQAVILRNVSEALKRVKGKSQITIRVNIADLEITTKHKDDFYRLLDNIENVNVLEDPGIEKGGCIIETDFGEIDARIFSQLDEIETAIRGIQPMRDV